MNTNTFKGGWQEFKGELKQKWGQLTDDDLLQVEGDYDKFSGVVRKRYADRYEEIEKWTEDWYSKREQQDIVARQATTSRNQL